MLSLSEPDLEKHIKDLPLRPLFLGVEEKRIIRLHQEDFCQALGFREKYQRYGGPGFKDCFELLMKTAIPIVDRDRLMRAAVFNYLIGNNDAHGKNFAILYDGDGNARLGPFYDILCTQAYAELTNDMCMKAGDHYNFNKIKECDWQGLSKTIGFAFAGLKKSRIRSLSRLLLQSRKRGNY